MKIVLRPAARPQTTSDVDAERERRLGLGFAFAGKRFQVRTMDLINITGAATAANLAVAAGAGPNNFRWSNPDVDFEWITADNSLLKLDAQSMIAMGQTAMAFVAAHMMRARQIKDRIIGGEVIEDIVDDALWT